MKYFGQMTIQRKGNEKIWLMHAGAHKVGEHGEYWRSYVDEGFVGIAGEIDDIRSFPKQDSITQELMRLGVGKDRNAIPTQNAKAYHQFVGRHGVVKATRKAPRVDLEIL